MLGVQGLVDFIKQVKGSRVTLLDGEYQSQSNQRLLTSGQLLHLPHLPLLPGEGHLQRGSAALVKIHSKHTHMDGPWADEPYPDTNASELVNAGNAALGAGAPLAVHTALAFILRLAAFRVSLLHHQGGFASGHQFLENLTKILRHL